MLGTIYTGLCSRRNGMHIVIHSWVYLLSRPNRGFPRRPHRQLHQLPISKTQQPAEEHTGATWGHPAGVTPSPTPSRKRPGDLSTAADRVRGSIHPSPKTVFATRQLARIVTTGPQRPGRQKGGVSEIPD